MILNVNLVCVRLYIPCPVLLNPTQVKGFKGDPSWPPPYLNHDFITIVATITLRSQRLEQLKLSLKGFPSRHTGEIYFDSFKLWIKSFNSIQNSSNWKSPFLNNAILFILIWCKWFRGANSSTTIALQNSLLLPLILFKTQIIEEVPLLKWYFFHLDSFNGANVCNGRKEAAVSSYCSEKVPPYFRHLSKSHCGQ